jgi:SWI/SNF-related matrix-associated actin-dependent regulator of chromatin subfamily A-like protein 1
MTTDMVQLSTMSVVQLEEEKPTIFFKEKGWVMSVPRYSLLYQDCGWIYNAETKLWYTKDDELVASPGFLEYVRPQDNHILVDRLQQRVRNVKVSYETNAGAFLGTTIYEDLYPFQAVTPREVLNRNILLADEMGLGKTIQAIMAINVVKPSNVLIVVPNMLVHSPWYDCIAKWLTVDTQVYIVPWSRLSKMDSSVYWDMVIVDEAHYAKNPSSARSKAFSALKAEHKMCLTGTPILGKPIEIFPIIQWLEPYLLGTQADFERNYCEKKLKRIPWGRGGRGYRYVEEMSGAKNLERLNRKLRETVMIARFKKDVLPQLPPKSRSVIQLNVGADVTRLEKSMLGIWREIKKQGAKNDLALWNSIFSIRKEAALLKVPMVNAAIDEIWEESGRPIVVWTHHHEVADAIYDHFKSRRLEVETLDGRKKPDERSNIVDQFQGGRIDILVAGLTAAGVGITLTESDICVFAELDWTPANMVQAEDRLHRIGQDKNVSIYYCVSPDSLDSRFARILADKQEIIDEFNMMEEV